MGITERRQRERVQRRAAILDAAEAVFARDGFEDVTMEAVADEAEVSKGTLYLYFESKGALRAAIAERWLAALRSRMTEHLSEAHTGLQGVGAVLRSYREHFALHPHHCQMALGVIRQSAAEDSPSVEAHRSSVRELVALIVQTIRRGQEDGSIRDDLVPATVAAQLWGSFLGVWLLAQHGEHIRSRFADSVDLKALVPSFHETLLRGLAHDPGASA